MALRQLFLEVFPAFALRTEAAGVRKSLIAADIETSTKLKGAYPMFQAPSDVMLLDIRIWLGWLVSKE